MKTYPRVTHAFYNSPWALLPEKWAEIDAFLQRKFAGEETRGDQPAAGPRDGVQMAGRVALVQLFGVIAQRMDMMTAISGGTSTEAFGRTFDALVADRQVSAIVMVVDSPGGSVFGVQELAQKIFDARGKKRVVAIADSMAASAAYWLATQASELVCTPGGMVGSVGVIASHVDESVAEEAAGRKTTLVYSGQYKAEGEQPLTSEALAYLQGLVDTIYGTFVAAVARGRGVTENRVQKDFGQGRVVLAKDAVARGMADRVATLEQVLTRLNGTSPAAAAARARAAELGV
jgi:signal peptide peptidase SppA